MSTHLNVCKCCGDRLTYLDREEIKLKTGFCHTCSFKLKLSRLHKEWKENLERYIEESRGD